MDTQKVYDLLKKIGTQLDGLESMFREMNALGNSEKHEDFGIKLRATSNVQQFSINRIRSSMQNLRDELDYLNDV